VNFLAVSDFKQRMWGEPGAVVVLSPQALKPLKENSGYDRIAIVCNELARRGEELGYNMILRLQSTFSIAIIGNNPGVPHAIKPKNFEDFQDVFRSHRIYLYTIRY